ncbi:MULTISPECIES: hypothetical protein [Sorangium]|uniref:Gingipain domain-containing protein n=1 Tax=Sorangium cellulosum TaxID=56 RepID=A0A4P2QWG7_SORCE|nr:MULTISPECIES: hypothetical protein [Sorangium]AUX33963.1 hypothetical protein SOCE836_061310 [Sorangium cellulosum]WCQ93273.1 hypothetical protein NQZ70_06021 [Sorangium sp. Soce836]
MQTMKDLQLLLTPYGDREPVLKDGLSSDAAAQQDVAGKADNTLEHFWEETGDPDDLEAQRWGVIAPEGAAGDRLIALIQPLIDARRDAQDGHEVKLYRVPPAMSPEEAARWRKQHFDVSVELARDLPRYQLLLGDLHEVPLALQQYQSIDGFVGRLCFQREREYEAYVDKVLRRERARAEIAGSAKFYTVHDGTAATMMGYRSLTQPALAQLKKYRIDAADLGDQEAPSPDEFLQAVRSPEPTVLFTVSHGAGAPRGGWKSEGDQRDRQGAMSFGREGKLTGGDLGDAPFLPGGIWFMLACYGGGTPDVSAYRHWLDRLKQSGQFGGQAQSVLAGLPQSGQRPFIARLPQVALANPNGPLAVMGHIDLAWTYSFEERDTGKAVSRPSKFVDVIRTALETSRVGSSFRELLKASLLTNAELTSLYDKAEREGAAHAPDSARLGHLWMLRQDLSGYVLLGDPAVRLPAARRRLKKDAASEAEPRAPEVQSGAAAKAAASPSAGARAEAPTRLPPDMDIDDVERAIGKVLSGSPINAVANEHGVEPAKLRELKDIYKAAGRAALGTR